MKTNALKSTTITGLFSLAILAFTACTQNEDIEMAAGRAISFQQAAMTKAETQVAEGSFMVAGYKGTTALGTKVFAAEEYDVTDGFDAPKYYDGVNVYWFYGYAEATGDDELAIIEDDIVYSEGSGPNIVFTTPETANVDLVTMATGSVGLSAQDESLDITFKHALSRVRFSAIKQHDGMAVVIKSVEISVPNNVLTIPYTNFGNADNGSSGTASSLGETPYTYTITGDQTLSGEEAAGYTDTYLYIVPQSVTSIAVTYTLEGALQTKSFTTDTEMLAGKAYNFQFTITANEIRFTTNLENWDPVTAESLTPAI